MLCHVVVQSQSANASAALEIAVFLAVVMHERARLNCVEQGCSFVHVAVMQFISPPPEKSVMGSMSQPFVLRENKQ